MRLILPQLAHCVPCWQAKSLTDKHPTWAVLRARGESTISSVLRTSDNVKVSNQNQMFHCKTAKTESEKSKFTQQEHGLFSSTLKDFHIPN